MFITKRYQLAQSDVFDSVNYPEIARELAILCKGSTHTPISFRGEIVISYLKHHSIPMTHIEANPSMADLIISGSFQLGHLEELFAASRSNKIFQSQLEQYIGRVFV